MLEVVRFNSTGTFRLAVVDIVLVPIICELGFSGMVCTLTVLEK